MSATGQPPFATDEPPPLNKAPPTMGKFAPAIPDFMRLGSVPVNYIQEIETDLLESVVFQEGSGDSVTGFARFQLQQKGFLHSKSKVFISLVPPADVSRAMYPVGVGVGNLVEKAVLKCGNVVINEISSWDHLQAFHSTRISNENNIERELYTTARCMNHAFRYDIADAGTSNDATHYGLEVGRDITDDGTTSEFLQMPFATMDGGSPEQSPSYSIDIGDLFPFMKTTQLPLYMMEMPLTIELTFRPPKKHRAVKLGGTANQEFLIDRNELKFCADYVYYGATDEMERYADANKQMTFSFVDYRAVSTSVTQASLQSDTVRNLGMANREVSKVLTVFNADRKNEDDLLQGLGALSTTRNASHIVGGFSYNLRYNDKFEFSSNITNTARLYSLLQDSQVMVHITRDEYSRQGVGYGATALFEGLDAKAQLSGNFFLNSTRLTGGRVGVRGIELHIKATDLRGAVTTMRNWCEYHRVAQLNDGQFSVFNA